MQTAGSAGESIAFGVGAAMPALMLLGYELEWTRVMLVAVLGGLLGILMMIPLRRAFIVKQHGVLPYPEGTACAKVLIVGEQGGSNARTVFLGFGVGFIYQILMQATKFWASEWKRPITRIAGYKKAVVSLEPSPMLLGVGYIIGPRISSVMVSGGIIAALLFVPMIAFFGDAVPGILPPGQKPIAELSAGAISGQYVRYIGAGAVAAGGILSMINALPLIVASVTGSLRDLRSGRSTGVGGVPRTERDLPMTVVILGSLGLVLAVAASQLIPTDLHGRLIGGVMIVLFGFLFVTVSSRITGVIGSSSNPISGMTIATLLLTCLIFVAARLGRAGVSPHGAVDRGGRLHRLVERRHHLAGSQDRLPGRRDPVETAGGDPGRGPDVRGRDGGDAPAPERGVHDRHRLPRRAAHRAGAGRGVEGEGGRARWEELRHLVGDDPSARRAAG